MIVRRRVRPFCFHLSVVRETRRRAFFEAIDPSADRIASGTSNAVSDFEDTDVDLPVFARRPVVDPIFHYLSSD